MEEETSLLNASPHDEDAILKSPQGSTTSKSPDDLVSTAPSTQQKKVILKRKLITTISVNETDDNKTEAASPSIDAPESKTAKIDDGSADETNGSEDDKKVVKLSELTLKDRLELRAKKFGAAPSTDALKQARAERFGITSPAAASSDGSNDKIASAPVSVDVLKKRAERFGGSVSTVMSKIENKEKLLKRQERFGASAASTNAPADPKAASEYAEKAKQRLERFKTSVK